VQQEIKVKKRILSQLQVDNNFSVFRQGCWNKTNFETAPALNLNLFSFKKLLFVLWLNWLFFFLNWLFRILFALLLTFNLVPQYGIIFKNTKICFYSKHKIEKFHFTKFNDITYFAWLLVQKQSGFFEGSAFFINQSEIFESILNSSDWLYKSRSSKKATSFRDVQTG